MAGVRITYNGFKIENGVHVDSFDSKPLFAEDGRSVATIEHTIVGTGLITGVNKTVLEDARTRLLRTFNPADDFKVEVGGLVLVDSTDWTGGDSKRDQFDGPQAEFKINRIVGEVTAVVAFTIRWWRYDIIPASGEVLQDVIAHRWTQEWDINDLGEAVHRVAGTLQVRSDATATGASGKRAGTNPDAYRELCVPPLPDGFRRHQMQFITDGTGNKIVYLVEDRQFANDLPHPASVGNGTFTFTRARSQDLLGLKVWDCELAAGPDVSAARLLDAAVLASKNRIDYDKDNIVSIQVREELFGSNKVGLRVIAQSISTKGAEGPGTLELPQTDFTLLDDQMAGVPGYVDKPPYGASLFRSLRRALFVQTDSTNVSVPGGVTNFNTPVPKALHEAAQDDAIVMTAVDPSGQVIDSVTQQLSRTGEDSVRQANIDNPYLAVRMFERTVVQDTGVILQRPQSIEGTALDLPIQVRRPKVYVVQEAILMRQGKPPEARIRPPVPGSILLSAEEEAGEGHIDGSGHHVFTVRHRRVYQVGVAALGRNDAYFIQELGTLSFMAAWPPQRLVQTPPDPRISNNSPGSNPWSSGGDRTVPVGPAPVYAS